MMHAERSNPSSPARLPGAVQSLRRVALLSLAALVSGCSLLGPKPSQLTPTSDPDSINVGYVLLYQIVATQKNSDKLLIIKSASADTRKLIKEISDEADKIENEIIKISKQAPPFKLDQRVLPLIEAKQREAASSERGKEFLGTNGKEFERLMILTQSGVLTTERNISRVMREEEKNPERHAFWVKTTKTFDELYAKLIDLLEAKYYK